MKLLLAVLALCGAVAVADQSLGTDRIEWLCNILANWVESNEASVQSSVLGTCHSFQAENVQSCAAADIPGEALALTKKLCGAVGNFLGRIPIIGGLFQPPYSKIYIACVGQGEALLDRAIIAACQGGAVNATQLCDSAFCGVWDSVQQAAIDDLHCTPIPRPGVCSNSTVAN